MTTSASLSVNRVRPRVGLFGFVGSGNLGNDAAFEVVLDYLRRSHPDAVVDAMCMGPERVEDVYRIPAQAMLWYKKYEGRVPLPAAAGLKVLGKAVALVRIAAWVRRHEIVVVPGAGALESTLPMRASGYPLAICALCLAGRVSGTKVALVSVGANSMKQRLTRWVQNAGARRAAYRSYRDLQSWEAMRARGVDVSEDPVYPDLVFGQPVRARDTAQPERVGVGLMAYFGGNDDRRRASALHAHYVDTMTRFVIWLLDTGHPVRIFWGDSDESIDVPVVTRLVNDVRRARPGLDPGLLVADPLTSPADLMAGLAEVGLFVGTRYHNVVSALRSSKPTISIGYSDKFSVLMDEMGLGRFTQSACSVDFGLLTSQFDELVQQRDEIASDLARRNLVIGARLDQQFDYLSTVLFSTPRWTPQPAVTGS